MPTFLVVQPTAIGEGDRDDGTSPSILIWLCPGHRSMQGLAAMARKGLGVPSSCLAGGMRKQLGSRKLCGPRTLTIAG